MPPPHSLDNTNLELEQKAWHTCAVAIIYCCIYIHLLIGVWDLKTPSFQLGFYKYFPWERLTEPSTSLDVSLHSTVVKLVCQLLTSKLVHKSHFRLVLKISIFGLLTLIFFTLLCRDLQVALVSHQTPIEGIPCFLDFKQGNSSTSRSHHTSQLNPIVSSTDWTQWDLLLGKYA